jgi:hypothetical protein
MESDGKVLATRARMSLLQNNEAIAMRLRVTAWGCVVCFLFF